MFLKREEMRGHDFPPGCDAFNSEVLVARGFEGDGLFYACLKETTEQHCETSLDVHQAI